jgi:hypothetical protein
MSRARCWPPLSSKCARWDSPARSCSLKTEDAYAEIVRWNGKVGDFTSLRKLSGPQYGVQDGDIVEAVISGDVITGIVNGVEVISVTDNAFGAGSPGIGFNFGVGDTNVDHGFTYFAVDSYND